MRSLCGLSLYTKHLGLVITQLVLPIIELSYLYSTINLHTKQKFGVYKNSLMKNFDFPPIKTHYMTTLGSFIEV